jgi:hypothetical protein
MIRKTDWVRDLRHKSYLGLRLTRQYPHQFRKLHPMPWIRDSFTRGDLIRVTFAYSQSHLDFPSWWPDKKRQDLGRVNLID